jgi:IPT/TIG domain
MRRITITCLTLASAALLVLPPAAGAAPAKAAKASTPTITRVTPMRIRVGALLTVRGRNFKAGHTKNTVIFRGPDGRSAFAKPRSATRTKLVVVVPPAVARLVARKSGAAKATRFKLRVLAGRFSKFTTRRLSPVVVPSGSASGPGGSGPGGGAPGGGGPGGSGSGSGAALGCPGPDYDGDLLSNTLEAQIKTDPCIADTDGDSVEDGYEFQSAIDLNQYPAATPLPYPGKRPYPNPLDPSDGTPSGTDYDGDGLLLREEFLLWLGYSADGVGRPSRPGSLTALVYSDGVQRSVNPAPSAGPAGSLRAWALDIDGNGVLSDDERDADGDGLGNWDEVRGRMTEAWWPAQHDGENEPRESAYPNLDFLDNEDTAPAFNAHTDPDMDGDGVLDGDDDNDHDGLSNQFEINRPGDWLVDAIIGVPPAPPANVWAYTNPFNPCKPFNSDRCHSHPPFGHYESDEVPPIGPNPPAGYPAVHPVTPDG